MGIVTTGNSVGGIIYPLVVRQLLPVVSKQSEIGTHGGCLVHDIPRDNGKSLNIQWLTDSRNRLDSHGHHE